MLFKWQLATAEYVYSIEPKNIILPGPGRGDGGDGWLRAANA